MTGHGLHIVAAAYVYMYVGAHDVMQFTVTELPFLSWQVAGAASVRTTTNFSLLPLQETTPRNAYQQLLPRLLEPAASVAAGRAEPTLALER